MRRSRARPSPPRFRPRAPRAAGDVEQHDRPAECAAIPDSENSTPSSVVVEPSAITPPSRTGARRGSRRVTGGRTRVDRRPLPGDAAEHPLASRAPQQIRDRQGADDVAAAAHADQQGALSVSECLEWRVIGGDQLALADVADLAGGAVELLVGHHRRPLEGQVAVDLDPRAAAVVLVLDAHRDGPRNPMDPEEQHVQRMGPLPGEALLGVVRGPDVEGRERLDHAVILGREVVGDLGPAADPHPVGLGDAAVLEQRPRGRLLVGPDALLEGAAKLRMVGLANQVVPLVVEGRVEEELVVLELEVLLSSRIPPLRRATSCSPSASARTVTAHSFNAIGMFRK